MESVCDTWNRHDRTLSIFHFPALDSSIESDPLDQDQAQIARHQGLLTGVEIKPAHHANGWLLEFPDTAGKHIPYTGHTGTEKVYHDLDQASALGRELGVEGIRIEERC